MILAHGLVPFEQFSSDLTTLFVIEQATSASPIGLSKTISSLSSLMPLSTSHSDHDHEVKLQLPGQDDDSHGLESKKEPSIS